MKKLILIAALMLVGSLTKANAGSYLETSSIVNVSSRTAAPSTILSGITSFNVRVEVWCYQLNNAGEQVVLRSASTGFEMSASTGSARIQCTPNTAARAPLILDYTGPLYGVTSSTYTIPVQVIRVK